MVSKTGDSRFESWLPRYSQRPLSLATAKVRGVLVQQLPLALLVCSGIVASILVLHLNRDGNFYFDEWIWFGGAGHADASTLFRADNGHLVLVPRLIYEGVLSTLGSDYLPFRLVNLSLVLSISILLFVLGRRRVGDWLAVLPAILMLFLGSAWDVLTSGIGINVNIAVATGLGAFLALERRRLRTDLLACALLTVGVAASPARWRSPWGASSCW